MFRRTGYTDRNICHPAEDALACADGALLWSVLQPYLQRDFVSFGLVSQTKSCDVSNSSYNRLGTTASHGCVRLTVKDAKWIFDHCPIGTKVVIYNANNPGPLGKPRAIKVPGVTGYDPTDIWSKGNPYNKKKTGYPRCKEKEDCIW